MKTTAKAMIFLAVLGLMAGCVSDRREGGMGPGGPGRQEGPGGQGGPGGAMSKAETALMQLNSLIGAAEPASGLALSAEQSAAILSILKDWRSALESNPKAKGDAYAEKIAALLTKEQKAYRPEPPRGDRNGSGGPQGGPPQGGPQGGPGGGQPMGGMQGAPQGAPGGTMLAEMLDDLIEALSED